MEQFMTKKTILYLLITLVAFNCSSDDDGKLEESESNVKLKKFTSTISGFINTSETSEIYYLNNGKPQAILDTYGNIHSVIYEGDKLFKFANNTYTFDTENRLKTITNLDYGICTLHYNSQNLLIRQEIVAPNSIGSKEELHITRDLSYNDNNQITEILETETNNYRIDKYVLEYNNDEQLTNYEIFVSEQSNTPLELIEEVEITYDSSRNPLVPIYNNLDLNNSISMITLKELAPSFLSNTAFGHYEGFKINYVPQNNILSTIISSPFNDALSENYSYNLIDDYPSSSEVNISGGFFSYSAEILWEYTTD